MSMPTRLPEPPMSHLSQHSHGQVVCRWDGPWTLAIMGFGLLMIERINAEQLASIILMSCRRLFSDRSIFAFISFKL